MLQPPCCDRHAAIAWRPCCHCPAAIALLPTLCKCHAAILPAAVPGPPLSCCRNHAAALEGPLMPSPASRDRPISMLQSGCCNTAAAIFVARAALPLLQSRCCNHGTPLQCSCRNLEIQIAPATTYAATTMLHFRCNNAAIRLLPLPLCRRRSSAANLVSSPLCRCRYNVVLRR